MAKKVATLRVHEIATQLGVTSKDIVAKCQAEDIPGITNHMSAISAGLAATIREWFSGGGTAVATAVETTARVDVEGARAKATKKAGRKPARIEAAPGDDGGTDDGAASTLAAPAAPAAAPALPDFELAPAPDVSPVTTTRTGRPTLVEPPAEFEAPTFQAPPSERIESQEDRPAIAASAPAIAPQSPGTSGTTEAPPVTRRLGRLGAGPGSIDSPAATESRSPVMNVPQRPKGVKAAGPMLQQPTKSKLAGPKVIRVETPEQMSMPKPGGGRRPDMGSPSGIGRGGPRAGRGAGLAPSQMPEMPGGEAGRGGRTAPSRRNKRRTASAQEDGGRVGRAFPTPEQQANWREQDLKERELRLNRSGGFFKAHRRDNLKKTSGGGQRALTPSESGEKVKVSEPITIKDLSAATGVKAADIVKELFLAGKVVTINSVIDSATALEVMAPHGIELEIVEQHSAERQLARQSADRTMVDAQPRPPVITILGHVDHGKTSLLDRIRNTNVAAGEAGGITQATSAFQVPVHAGDKNRLITFIDTPGHEAFTEMRARGAKVTDVVVLVVAADDGVMPQTVESINHARAADVPIVVALNKIDKPEATDSNIQRILGQLAQHGLNPVEWGGTTEIVRTSATRGDGVQDLLEILDYQAELRDLKSDFGGHAEGTVIEARVAEGRGPVANVLVQQGLLHKGDFIVIGRAFGRVRDIVNDHGKRIDEAGPSTPVAISGMDEGPDAGDKFYCVGSLKEAESAAQERRDLDRERNLFRERVTLDNIFKKLAESGTKELPLVVKADVQGSVDTLEVTLAKISTEEVKVAIKHAAVGGINESDVLLAEAAGAIIVGFNVTASPKARREAENRGVDIRLYDVIYDVIDDVTKAAEGLLEPEHRLEVLGHAEVRQVFKISRVGMIAGCYVTDGTIERNAQIRVTRGGIVVEKDRRLEQLKRFKDDAKDVRAGQECGMKIDGYDDIKVGDVLECYKTLVVSRTL